MPFYRLYFLDESAMVSGGHELQCDDDREARAHALRMGSGKLWELWRGREKLAVSSGPAKPDEHVQ